MAILMILFVGATLGLGIVLSGAGLGPFIVVDAMILTIVAPAAMVMIGTPPAMFVRAFRTAIRPDVAYKEDVAASLVVLRGTGRMIALAVALFSMIALIAMLVGIRPGAGDHMWSLGRGVATVAAHVLYALILQTVVIHPLVIRVERVLVTIDQI